MNEELKRELDKVASDGQGMAKRLFIRKVTVLAVALSAIIGCALLFTPLPCIVSQLLILMIVRMFSVKTQRTVQDALYVRCDPYLQYAFLDSYSKTPFANIRKAKEASLVSKAQCMVLAGEPQMAISLLNEIKDLKKLPAPTRAVCYNLMLRSYAQYGWEQKRRDLAAQVEKEIRGLPNKMAVYLDVILRLESLAKEQEAGNVEAIEEYYDGNEGTYMFQKVSAHFALADVLLRAGRSEEAKEHIDFVKEHGNKLYYIKELGLQQKMEKSRKREEDFQKEKLENEQREEESE